MAEQGFECRPSWSKTSPLTSTLLLLSYFTLTIINNYFTLTIISRDRKSSYLQTHTSEHDSKKSKYIPSIFMLYHYMPVGGRKTFLNSTMFHWKRQALKCTTWSSNRVCFLLCTFQSLQT